jgi:hypothetical protein
MILNDNQKFLHKNNPYLLRKIHDFKEESDEISFVQEETQSGCNTLRINLAEKKMYIHSKYDPRFEATKLIGQLKGIEQYNHVLFLGVGLGYHIKEFQSKYPNIKISIAEPNVALLRHFLSYQNLKDFHLDNINGIFLAESENQINFELERLQLSDDTRTFIYTLPVYEKLYENKIKIFLEKFKEYMKDKRSYIATNASFQKRWTINSIKNFPQVLETPNILHDIDKDCFMGKPAIIVAAGPSLTDELENIRYIKENGLAYIFSVGSAINSLIEHGISPDAACTYDPTVRNQVVFQKIKDKEISNVPMIFGSSVGFETLIDYPGRKLHMLTSQDTISPHLLDTSKGIDMILDAPSIAVITFQLLGLLGCNPIILAGQNLAYRNSSRYAEGISYEHIGNQLSDEEKEKLITVESVNGDQVYTTEDFNSMRKQLELFIKASPHIEVINTTTNGANIDGTIFMPLSEVITDKLAKKKLVDEKWFEPLSGAGYDLTFVEKKLNNLKNHKKRFESLLQSSLYELNKIERCSSNHYFKNMEHKYAKFDNEFNKMKNNHFYQAIIEPMIRVQNKRLSEKSHFIRYQENQKNKANLVVESFGEFLKECHIHLDFVTPYFYELQESINLLKVTR